MKKILHIIKNIFLFFAMLLFVVQLIQPNTVTSTISVHAQNARETAILEKCKTVAKKKINFASLFNISNFLPLIPQECSSAEDGVVPLPLNFLFDIIIRTAGFLFSFAFYLLPVAIIVYGARVLLIPFDPTLNKSDFTQASTIGRTITAELAQFVTGILIILFSYTVVFTILGTLQIESSTDISQFFSFTI
jgi:hypothetical protein